MKEALRDPKILAMYFSTLLTFLGVFGSLVNTIMRKIPEETYRKIEEIHPASKNILRMMRKIFIDIYPALAEAREATAKILQGKVVYLPPSEEGEKVKESLKEDEKEEKSE